MAKKVDKLNDAQKKKDDEFYSTPLVVQTFFRMLDPDALRGKKVWLPFDSERSEFTKWFENPENQAKWGWNEFRNTSDDFFCRDDMLEWCDIVVSNPPFSIKTKIIDLLENRNCDFCLITGYATICSILGRRKLFVAADVRIIFGQFGKNEYTKFSRPDGSFQSINWGVVSNKREFLTKTNIRRCKQHDVDFDTAVAKGWLTKTDPDRNGDVFWHCACSGRVPKNFFEPVYVSPGASVLCNSDFDEYFERLSDFRPDVKVGGKNQYYRILVRRRK